MLRKFIATLLLLALPALPALAEKPDKPEKSKGHGNAEKSHGGGNGNGGSRGHGGSHDDGSSGDHDQYRRFSSQDRGYWHEYWEDQYEHGH